MKKKETPAGGNNRGENLDSIEQGKDIKSPTQLQTIFSYLHENIATASMVSAATGVPQKNICRFKRDLELAGQLWEITKTYCNQTGFKAWYLSTNPERASPSTQLKLF